MIFDSRALCSVNSISTRIFFETNFFWTFGYIKFLYLYVLPFIKIDAFFFKKLKKLKNHNFVL